MIDIIKLKEQTEQLWNSVEIEPWSYPSISEADKNAYEQKINAYLSELKAQDQHVSLLSVNPLMDLSWMEEEQKKQFYQYTTCFLQDAKQFDAALSDEEIFQALRNIWIVFMLQMIFQKPITYHSAIFGYSMLYPYSDNYLDQHAESEKDKILFNNWFTRRLHGFHDETSSPLLQKISALVQKIENEYDRELYPDVYESLYHIQDAQILSQRQYKKLSSMELCDIAIIKGGASVVADGFLIDGALSETEKQFCMDFGFSLQIADDIQDIKEDQMQHHHTMANMALEEDDKERLFLRDLSFLKLSLKKYHKCADVIEDFIMNNTRFMMSMSILPYKDCYSSAFFKKVVNSLPAHSDFLINIIQNMRKNSISIDAFLTTQQV